MPLRILCVKGLDNVMKTYSAKAADIQKNWVLIDATDAVVGRVAAQIAMLLRGKHKPTYTPHANCGDRVIVINADKVKFTGKKYQEKVYYKHTGYPGGIKETTPRRVLEGAHPERVLLKAVERMLPRGPLFREILAGSLRVYAGDNNPHAAQQPRVISLQNLNSKNVRA